VFKSAIFAVLLMSFYVLEGTLVGMWHGKTLVASLPALGDGTIKGMSAVSLITFVVLMPFVALREIGRELGDNKLYELFFLRRSQARVSAIGIGTSHR
jgi:hypothetical protein